MCYSRVRTDISTYLWLSDGYGDLVEQAQREQLAQIDDLEQAWELGDQLCNAGYTPDRAAARDVPLEE